MHKIGRSQEAEITEIARICYSWRKNYKRCLHGCVEPIYLCTATSLPSGWTYGPKSYRFHITPERFKITFLHLYNLSGDLYLYQFLLVQLASSSRNIPEISIAAFFLEILSLNRSKFSTIHCFLFLIEKCLSFYLKDLINSNKKSISYSSWPLKSWFKLHYLIY